MTTRESYRIKKAIHEVDDGPVVMFEASTLATRGMERHFEDTRANRQQYVEKALDEGKRVESFTDRHGNKHLIIFGSTAVEDGDKISIDGEVVVQGVDGSVMRAADVLVVNDLVEVSDEPFPYQLQDGQSGTQGVTVKLVDLADEFPAQAS